MDKLKSPSEIILYTTQTGEVRLEVYIAQETV
jgi:hypothetical protein